MLKKTYLNHEFRRLATAGIIGNCLIVLILYTDRLIAGMFLGADAAAAVNLVAPIGSIAMAIGYLVTIGVPIKYCEAMGGFKKDRADKIFGMGIISAISIGILNVLLAFLFKGLFFDFYGVSGEIAELCDVYFNWMAVVTAFMPIESLLYDMVLVDGDDKTVVVSKIIEGLVKIGMSIILVCIVGIKGLVWGSLAGYAISLSCCFLFVLQSGLHPGFLLSFYRLCDLGIDNRNSGHNGFTFAVYFVGRFDMGTDRVVCRYIYI